MIAVPRETSNTPASESASVLFLSEAYNVAGMMREVAATAMRDDMVEATVALKELSSRLMPEEMKQHPRTRRMLERIEPSMLAWTMRISPCASATIETWEVCQFAQTPGYRAYTHNQLHSIPKSSIHQPANRLAHLRAQLFRRKAQQRRQRHNCQEVHHKGRRRVYIHHTKYYTRRHKHEQDIDVVRAECQPRQVEEVHRISDPRPVIFVERFAVVAVY